MGCPGFGLFLPLRWAQRQSDAIESQHAQHMPDRNARLTGFDPGDRLDVHAETRRRNGLPFAGIRARQPGRGTHVLDCLEGVATNVCGDALALGHSGIVAACWEEGAPPLGAER